MKSWSIGALILTAVVLSAWWLVSAKNSPAVVTSEAGTLAANSGLARLPGGTNQSGVRIESSSSGSTSARHEVSPLHREFRQTKDYFSFFKSLEGRTDPESLFYKASVLDRCRRWANSPTADTTDQRIKKFNASVTGPYKDIRQAINAKLLAEAPVSRCANFKSAISEAEVDAAYDAAAKAGDIRGQLDRLHRTLLSGAESTKVPAQGVPFTPDAKVDQVLPAGPSEADVALLKQALASKDPVQIEAAGPLLSAKYRDYELKFGDGNGLVGIPDYFLWRSVACHYAGGCGSDSYFFQQNCAVNGRCDVSSFDEQLQRYIFNEADWRNFQLYRATLINAIDTQDWSLLQERRGPRTNTWGNQIVTGNRSPRFNLRYY